MKTYCNFDEKQLADRGTAFRYGFIAALAMMVSAYFAADILEIQIERSLLFYICFWIPEIICAVTLIVKDAYDGINSHRGRTLMAFFGILGLILIVLPAVRMLSGKYRFAEEFSHLFVGFCVMIQSLVYWVKQYSNQKKFAD